MLFANIALEVGGAFLFVACLMYLSISGRLGDMFRDRAPGSLLVVLVTGFAIYHWGWMLWDRVTMPDLTPAPRAASEPANVNKIPASALASPRARIQPAAQRPQIVIVQEVPAAQIVVPAAIEPAKPASTDSDPYESKTKHGIRAVGRFLHLKK